ncbi:MAG: peptidoglycan-associated lipoprotein Pal [Gammaproteobacteria bacterium]|jgi:peptidoglycan-associated lipoprotein
MRYKYMHWVLMLTVILFFSGCESVLKNDGSSTSGATVSEGDGASTSGASRYGDWSGNPLDNPNSPLYTKVIYFDFDTSDIRSEFYEVLRAHAEYLVSNPQANLTIEGHCDERGTREYNIGLGERRAMAIKRFFEAEGVEGSRINTISYGEERPADDSHGEAAWAMNRRGILLY